MICALLPLINDDSIGCNVLQQGLVDQLQFSYVDFVQLWCLIILVALWKIGPNPVIQHTPNSGSTKWHPKRSEPLSSGLCRSLVGGWISYLWIQLEQVLTWFDRRHKPPHCVRNSGCWIVRDPYTFKALKWSKAGPICIASTPWSDHAPLLSGESQVSTLHPSGATGWHLKSNVWINSV